ncbi:hypothetical protein FQN54_000414 [Arachnomyces sp. PD_36]|nr:hypothetical protein FQN54_000414 [Arachnomyces sp. PD_36]
MPFLTHAMLAAASLAAIAQAAPKVIPVEPNYECDYYGGMHAPFALEINQCTDPATGEQCSIEGYQHSVLSLAEPGAPSWEQRGFITFPDSYSSSNSTQEYPLTCNVGAGFITMLWIDAPTSRNTTRLLNWSIVSHESNHESDNLMWGYYHGDSFFPSAYHHEDEDGALMEGAFIGYENSTTWAAMHVVPAVPSMEPYWSLRVLGIQGGDPEDLLEEGEYSTFLKIRPL